MTIYKTIKIYLINAALKQGVSGNEGDWIGDGANNCWSGSSIIKPGVHFVKVLDWFHIGKRLNVKLLWVMPLPT